LHSGQAQAVLEIADELSTRGLSYRAALADLAVLLSRIAIIQRVAQAADETDPLMQDMIRLAQTLHPDAVQLFYTIAVHSRSELAIAPDEYAGFVMACLRMLSLFVGSGAGQQPVDVALPLSPASAPAQALSAIAAPSAVAAQTVMTAPVVILEKPSKVQAPVASAPALKVSVAQGAPQPPTPPWENEPASVQAAAAVTEQGSEVDATLDTQDEYVLGTETDQETFFSNAMPDYLDDIPSEGRGSATAPEAAALSKVIVLPEPWASFSAKLPLSGMASQLARQSECAGVSGHVLRLRVPTKALTEGAHADRLRTVLTEYFGFAVQLQFDIAATQGQSAHAMDVAAQVVRQELAERSVQNDPFVQALLKDFGAQVVPGSIRPSASL
jgi:DNA polymerase-3 subunit gamma/tau